MADEFPEEFDGLLEKHALWEAKPEAGREESLEDDLEDEDVACDGVCSDTIVVDIIPEEVPDKRSSAVARDDFRLLLTEELRRDTYAIRDDSVLILAVPCGEREHVLVLHVDWNLEVRFGEIKGRFPAFEAQFLCEEFDPAHGEPHQVEEAVESSEVRGEWEPGVRVFLREVVGRVEG